MEEHLHTTSKTFVVASVGCRTNQYESEAFKHQLEGLGYAPAADGQVADLCLIHTCAVTESAESSSRHAIRSLVSRHKGSRVVITGCLAKKEANSLAQIEGVTDVIASEEKETVIQKLFPGAAVGPFSIARFDGHTRAFVKIQDGCNHFCSYCTVPYLRGPSRSRPMDSILDEVRALVSSGYQEIVLTGVNIGDYVDSGRTLTDVIRQVDAEPGVKRLRLSSINPNEVDASLLDVLAYGRATCPSIHLVLQSGSNRILQRMRRLYTRELYVEKVAHFRDHCPECTFTTDIIVGFPGEEETDFQETLDIIREVQFLKVHMFPYSERPHTRAARCTDTVPLSVIKERKAQVLELSDRIAYQVREAFVGRTMEILTENADGYVQGQTKNGLPVLLPNVELPSNQFVRVALRENTTCGLLGTLDEDGS